MATDLEGAKGLPVDSRHVAFHRDQARHEASVDADVCVDGLAPQNIANLRSDTHTANVWTKYNLLRVLWDPAKDNGCAGIQGLASTVSLGSPRAPTAKTLGPTVTLTTLTLPDTPVGSPAYFNIRAIDHNNYLSPGTASVGPFYVDTVKPRVTQVSINEGDSPKWTPSGDGVFYRRGRLVMRIDIRDGEPVGEPQVVYPARNIITGPSYEVTADGTRMLAVQLDEAAIPREIYVISDFFAFIRSKLGE